MNTFKIQLVVIAGIATSAVVPATGFCNDNWSNYTPVTRHPAGKMHDLKKWESGSNFQMQNNLRYLPVTTQEEDASRFKETQPQKKSVNPWKIKKTSKSNFSETNTKRPWGTVPEQFNKKPDKKDKNSEDNKLTDDSFKTKFRSLDNNNNLLMNQNRNPSLLPITGHFPTYSDPGGFSPMYSNPGYGYYGRHGSYPFYGRRPGYDYLSRYRWR